MIPLPVLGPTATVIALSALVVLAVGGLAYALLFNRLSSTAQAEKRIDQVQSRNPAMAAAKGRTNDPARRRKSVQDTLKEMEEKQKARSRKGSAPPITLRLQQAGLTWSRRTFIVFSVVAGFFFLGLTYFLHMPLYACALLGVCGGLGLPRWVVNFLRKRRFKKFLNEFPNAVDVIVRGIKAGLPLNDCVRIIANEASEPVKTEFRLINEGQTLGLSLPEAVTRMPERVPLPEANFFAIVIQIQAQAGGNLSEALGNLSRVLRERKKMKGKINAMSMEAKASGAIIGALPVIVMVLVYISSPKYISLLFTEDIGHVILGGAAVWMAAGIIVMRNMINFDY